MRKRGFDYLVGWLVAIAIASGALGLLLQLARYGQVIEFCCSANPVP